MDAQREADKAATQSIESKVIDLTLDSDGESHQASDSDSDVVIVEDLHPRPKGPPNTLAGPSKPEVAVKSKLVSESHSSPSTTIASVNSVFSKAAASKPKKLLSKQKEGPLEWSCPTCTLLNPAHALQCEACQMRRPVDEEGGWSCLTCGENGNPHECWTCRWCGVVKLHS